MSTVILVRHGRSTANVAGVLAGRTPGINLDDTGLAQAATLAERLAGVKIGRLVSSPLERCRQTLEPLAAATGLEIVCDLRVAEVDYGDWTGRKLSELADEPLWRTVQLHPSGALFPGGESLAAVAVRAVLAVREHCAALGAAGAVVLCSHGDVIKSVLADALGLHLDSFQRIVVSPGSVSVIRYSPLRPFVERINDTGSLEGLRAETATSGPDAGDAAVGGDPGIGGPGTAGPTSQGSASTGQGSGGSAGRGGAGSAGSGDAVGAQLSRPAGPVA